MEIQLHTFIFWGRQLCICFYRKYIIVMFALKVIYHPLYSINIFVTNKSKLPQDGAQVFLYMGWLAIMWSSQMITW